MCILTFRKIFKIFWLFQGFTKKTLYKLHFCNNYIITKLFTGLHARIKYNQYFDITLHMIHQERISTKLTIVKIIAASNFLSPYVK